MEFISTNILVLCIIGVLIYIIFFNKIEYFTERNPCTDYLSDIEFLQHMIPHHQVAIDMSYLLQPITNNPIMKDLCRNIIWQQKYEITMMHAMINRLPDVYSNIEASKNYEKSKLEYYEPVKTLAKDGKCNPMFFKPNEHSQHMKHMKTTDISYLEHMIPHHQVAVDMCKRLLKHTANTHMMALCYDIIREQENEILMMNQMIDNFSTWQFKSNLI